MGKSGLVSNSDATSEPLIGAEIADLAARTRKLEAHGTADKSVGALFVEVDSVVGFQPAKHGLISPVIRYLLSGDVRHIKTVILQRDEIITPTDYESLRDKQKTADITDAQRSLGSVDLPFGGLEPLKIHDVIIVIGSDSFGGEVQDPIVDPDFAGYPGNALLTFTTPPDVGTCSTPSLARVIENFVNEFGDGTLASVTLRVFADESETATFDAQKIVQTSSKLVKVDGGTHKQYQAFVDDPDALFIDVSIGDLEIGLEYDWVKNTGIDSEGSGVASPALTTVPIFAGGFRDPSDGLASLVFANLNAVSQDGGTAFRLKWRLTQPGPVWPGAGPYRLISFVLERKEFSEPDSAYNQLLDGSLIAPQYNRPGDILIKHTVATVSGTAYQFRLTVTSTGGFFKQFVSGSLTP